jgi:hypothetical protein
MQYTASNFLRLSQTKQCRESTRQSRFFFVFFIYFFLVNVVTQQVKTIIEEKSEKRAARIQKADEESEEMRDLLDIMMDSQNEEGAVLTRQELADQTKTYAIEREGGGKGQMGRIEMRGEKVLVFMVVQQVFVGRI